MRALEPEVFDTVWAGVKALIPVPPRTHPLGCHRPRALDRDCLEVMLVRLATGCSFEDAERLSRLSPREAELYREWIANDRRLRAMVDELRAVAAEATDFIIEEARRTEVEV